MIGDHVHDELISKIADYLRRKCELSIVGTWRRNHFDEDSITAAFFESLAIENQSFLVNSSLYNWSIDYATTSSRGRNPLESLIGADLILFVEIQLNGEVIFRKGILIQSKMTRNISRNTLEGQISSMESYVPQSSVVLAYANESYTSCVGAEYLDRRNQHWSSYSTSFCNFLAGSFITCKYGVEDLFYDFSGEQVVYKSNVNVHIAAQRATRILINRKDMQFDSNIQNTLL